MSAKSNGVKVFEAKIKYAPTYEVKAYIGSRRGYNGATISEQEIIDIITHEQAGLTCKHPIPVRMTKTEFICLDYREEGWELAAINYPRYPQYKETILAFMLQLGQKLCCHLEQNRVSVVAPDRTTMYESPDAEQSHKEKS